MTEPASLETSVSHVFLDGLNEAHRMRLIAQARPLRAVPGEYLGREGEPAHAFYLIQAGHVGIGTHLGERGTVPIQTLGPGDVVGWSWLLPPHDWQFDVRAVDVVQGLVFDAAVLRDLCEQDHEVGYHVLKQLLAVISGRLASSRIHQLDIYK